MAAHDHRVCRPRTVAYWITNVAVAVVLALGASTASAGTISLAPPLSSYSGQTYTGQWVPDAGPLSRDIVFEDLQPFLLNFVRHGTEPDRVTTLTASVYSFSGTSTVGALLASSQFVVADGGRGFYDVPLNYAFQGTGSRYMLSMAFSAPPQEATFFDFEGFGDFNQPVDSSYSAGPFSVLDGKSSGNGNSYLRGFAAPM